METWWKYVEALIGDDTVTEAARKAGFDKSAFTRWKNGANADPAFVVKLVRAYDGNVLQALVIAGLITQQEARLNSVRIGMREALETATDREIADEVWKRMVEGRLGSDGEPFNDGPSLSVIQDIDSGTHEPVAALRSERNKEFEARENE